MNIKLYLHIGTSKTGTSAIQQFLCDNRIILANIFKVLYPDLGSSILLPTKGKGSSNNCKFLNETLGKDDHEKFKNELVKCFLFAVRKKIPTIVLSCESIFQNKQWAKIFSDLVKTHEIETKIILYLRRQDLLLESGWKQWGVKNTDFKSIYDYYNSENTRNIFDYYSILKYWLKYFDKDQIKVRIFEKSVIGNDVVEDFLKQINCYNHDVWGEKLNAYNNINSGFTPDVIQFLNFIKLDNIHNHQILIFLSKLLPSNYKKVNPFKSYGILTKNDRIEILNHYSEGNREIARMFFEKSDSELFERVSDEDLKMENDASSKSEMEVVVRIFMELLLAQEKRIRSIENKMSFLSRLVPISRKMKRRIYLRMSR